VKLEIKIILAINLMKFNRFVGKLELILVFKLVLKIKKSSKMRKSLDAQVINLVPVNEILCFKVV